MKSWWRILVACSVLTSTQILLAEEPRSGPASSKRGGARASSPAGAQEAQAAPDEGTLSHRHQFHLGVDAGFGYRMLFRYDTSPRCAPYDPKKTPSDQQKFCGFGSAPAISVSIGFAPVGFFEPFVFGRFGLGDEQQNTNMGKMVLVGGGARLYTMSDDAFKFFFAPWLGLDFTSGPVKANDTGDRAMGLNEGSYRTDVLVGLQIGPQYDISKYFGIYAAGGLTFDMLRYLGATADLSIGVQGRAP